MTDREGEGAVFAAERPAGEDPGQLASLLVLDCLEVGPVSLEPRRLICPYRVTGPEGQGSTELVYRFEEDVFTPGEAASLNLASMMAAQAALNYGLFCREIVFHGPFDRADRAFIREMAADTAREIFVNKILTPNPFLKDQVKGLPPLRRKSYLLSRLVFTEAPPAESRPWAREREGGVAVLSSGGKESLLSQALLEELGQDPHPVFVNESGRHWFTALNAYRAFKNGDSRTARVWTNTDRVFTWMLRRIPFIRQDFERVRADIYPLRLWTVAVFIFGALPLLRARGLSRLVVGDEYDTTVRARFEGIPHHAGLFDQSLPFDRALTRYFHAKGWRVSQFSLLRPLSELLIEKILLERYPNMQRLQVSCHAAHTEGDRALPCGRCEKCRRIVGMLTALGGDPTVCGYTPSQVRGALDSLAGLGVHQEAEAASHTLYLLAKRGMLPELPEAAPRPEVMKLRFHPERSPVEGVPRDLRRPLYSIFLEHAQGAIRREGRRWEEMDLLESPDMDRPGYFESPVNRRARGGKEGEGKEYELGRLTWPLARERLREVDLALLPVGAVEQHGPHLPLDTDAFDALHLSLMVAKACQRPRPLVLPLIPYGVSYHHEDFPGTLSLSPDTLSKVVYEVGMGAARQGVNKLVIVNGHGGNSPALNFAAQLINRDSHIFTCVESGETSDHDISRLVETDNDVHAGEEETSTSLAVRPELVRMEEARPFVPRFSSRFLDFTSKRSVNWYAYTAQISETGVLGDPTRASREKGERIWEIMVSRLLELVEHLKGLTLEEIYQRRY